MVPTGAGIADDGDVPVRDEPIPEVEAALDDTDHDGLEAFLLAVRTMVHGDGAPLAVEKAAQAFDHAELVEEDPGEWLPGVWEAERPLRRARRGARRADRKQRVPAQADGSRVDASRTDADRADPARESATEARAPGTRRDRRRHRRQEAARAIALAVPAVDAGLVPVGGPAEDGAEDARTPRRARRRDRRRRAGRLEAVAQDATVADAPTTEQGDLTVGPPGDGRRAGRGRRARRGTSGERAFRRSIARAAARGESGPPRNDPETLAEHLARVDAAMLPRRSRRRRPRTPRWVRRGGRVVLMVAVIAACVAVPWAVPSVPQAISDLLPDDGGQAVVHDPPVAPPSDAFVGPVGVVQQAGPLVGVRLQAAGRPREVRVPRLHVDSDVVPITGQSGTLLPPSDPQLLGWWQEGSEVGAGTGTAVVTGHTVHTGGGALDQLDQLVVGDVVRVRTDRGWIRYVVQRTRIYSTEELAREADRVFRLDGPGRLVLITCDDWNGSFYESNAVVVATPFQDLPDVPEQ